MTFDFQRYAPKAETVEGTVFGTTDMTEGHGSPFQPGGYEGPLTSKFLSNDASKCAATPVRYVLPTIEATCFLLGNIASQRRYWDRWIGGGG